MDTAVAGVAALVGGAFLKSRASISVPQLAAVEIGIFVLGYLGYKLAKALVWPFYFSEMRHVPGPKVRQTTRTSMRMGETLTANPG